MVPSLEIMHTDSMADTLYTKTIKSKKNQVKLFWNNRDRLPAQFEQLIVILPRNTSWHQHTTTKFSAIHCIAFNYTM